MIDHGIVLKVRCPHCRELGCFRLVENTSHFGLFGAKTPEIPWGLRCSLCTYTAAVSITDLDDVQRLNRDAREFEKGNLSGAEFRERLVRSSAVCISELLDAAEVLFCSHCGEEVPHTFELCWNCGLATSNSIDQSVAATEPLQSAFSIDPVLGIYTPVVVHQDQAENDHEQ